MTQKNFWGIVSSSSLYKYSRMFGYIQKYVCMFLCTNILCHFPHLYKLFLIEHTRLVRSFVCVILYIPTNVWNEIHTPTHTYIYSRICLSPGSPGSTRSRRLNFVYPTLEIEHHKNNFQIAASWAPVVKLTFL